MGVGDAALAKIGQFAEALDHGQGEKQEDGEAGEPGRDFGSGGCAAGEHAQRIRPESDQNVHQRNSLEVEGISGRCSGVEQQPKAEGSGKPRQKGAGGGDQDQGDGQAW